MADAMSTVTGAESAVSGKPRKPQSQLPWLTPSPTSLTGMNESGRAVLDGIKQALFNKVALAFAAAALKKRRVHTKKTVDGKKGRVKVKPEINTLMPEHADAIMTRFVHQMHLSKSFADDLGIKTTKMKRVNKNRLSTSDIKRAVRTVCPFVDGVAIKDVLTPAARSVAAKIAHLAADIAGEKRHTVEESDICDAFFILSGGRVLVPFKTRSGHTKKAKSAPKTSVAATESQEDAAADEDIAAAEPAEEDADEEPAVDDTAVAEPEASQMDEGGD